MLRVVSIDSVICGGVNYPKNEKPHNVARHWDTQCSDKHYIKIYNGQQITKKRLENYCKEGKHEAVENKEKSRS